MSCKFIHPIGAYINGAVWAYVLPQPGSGGGLDVGAPTLLLGQTPSLLWLSCLALLGKSPCHTWVFLYCPMHLCGREHIALIALLLSVWTVMWGRHHVTPTLPRLMATIGQHPWRGVCSHSLLLLSVIKENQPVRRWWCTNAWRRC